MPTPPPSTSSTSSAPTSGVAPPEGYTADTGAMASQAKTIHDAAEDAAKDVKDVKPAKVSEADFGTEHTKWAADYTAAIEQLGTGATAMCNSLTGLAQQIGSAGKSYDAAESDQAAAATQSGSGM
ncbi:hypothetical protein [Qaidamihabitans albus]|uniref:hypothetical protein n=1 Tax=Qaidamihabitans albus TaxID=2795733 RepID=UPI0027DD64BD|nr:hypothetical protein [Qaidamihabitans albus]